MKDKILKSHTFCFNRHDNGGESLTLKTDFISNGDPDGYYVMQKFTLQSYSNGASFELCGALLMPDGLRDLANELEKAMNSIAFTSTTTKTN